MAETTAIQWCDATVNLWWGCVEVGPGCDNCYARELAKRFKKDLWGVNKEREEKPSAFKMLDKLQRQAFREKRRLKVFVNSMSDLAEILPESHPSAKMIDNARCAFFGLIEAGWYPNLDLIWLTKRVGNIPKLPIPASWIERNMWPSNLRVVATVTNQQEADRDIPKLLEIPIPVRGVSIEPMLGMIDLQSANFNGADSLHSIEGLHWVICGGESGPNARPMHPNWARSLRDQCQLAGVPFFFKQWGEWGPDYSDSVERIPIKGNEFAPGWNGGSQFMFRVGEKRAGRLLDGREWNEFPGESR